MLKSKLPYSLTKIIMKFNAFKKTAIFLFVLLLWAGTPLFAYERDWRANPAWIEIAGARRVCAVGDIHGAFDQMAATLKALGVAERTSPDSFTYNWIGKDTVLIFLGDYSNRGLYTKQVYDAIHDLQRKAPKDGGQVIALLGNHEIRLLNGEIQEKAAKKKSKKNQDYQNTIDSFTRDGLDYNEAVSEKGFYGKMVRNMPLFAVINGYFFSHGGLNNDPVSKATLSSAFMDAIEKGDFNKGILVNEEMLIWNRDWWDDFELVERNLKLLGVSGVVFGHTPGAFGKDKGKIASKYDKIVAIDIGMTPLHGYSNGGGLEILMLSDNKLQFKAIYPDLPEEHLFTVSMPTLAYVP